MIRCAGVTNEERNGKISQGIPHNSGPPRSNRNSLQCVRVGYRGCSGGGPEIELAWTPCRVVGVVVKLPFRRLWPQNS